VTSPDSRLDRLIASVHPSQVWVILDIDRTLINGTSWYRACVTPGLLLSPPLIEQFRELNDRAYGACPTLDDAGFRRATLDLLELSATPNGLSDADLGDAGRRIGAEMAIYPEPFSYLKQLQLRHSSKLRVLYLTAGYEPFMQGVIERLHQRRHLSRLDYQVFGTQLGQAAGHRVLGEVCDGPAKARVVRALLRSPARLALVADDDHHDLIPFEEVEAAGGVALPIAHSPGRSDNTSWRRFHDEHGEPSPNHADLMHGKHRYSLADLDQVLRNFGPELDDLPPAPNGIGIGQVPAAVFHEALDGLTAQLSCDVERAAVRTALLRLCSCDGSDVLLRADLFYLGCPPYLFGDPRTAEQRWQEQLQVARDGLAPLERSGLLDRWPSLSRPQRWLVLCLLDHLKNAATQAIDVLARASIESDESQFSPAVDALAEQVYSAYWSLLLTGRHSVAISGSESWDELAARVRHCRPAHILVRELDDPYVLALSALSLIDEFEARQAWPTGVLDFASGGLELGLTLRAIAEVVASAQPSLDVVHIVYSSKHRLAAPNAEAIEPTFTKLLCRVPPHQRDRLRTWVAGEGEILLYDNNVATFATLAATKAVLSKAGRCQARAAVACVYYDNLVRWLKHGTGEQLCVNWETTLDFAPVADYVTAFSTWGTSDKTNILDAVHGSRRPLAAPAVPSSTRASTALFKVCRVHNVVDLAAVVHAGANLIGIHAVSPPEPLYSDSQLQHRPILRAAPDLASLPVPRLEVAAIREMVGVLPAGVRPVLVLEQDYDLGSIRDILAAYGLDPLRTLVQLQCRVNEATVIRLTEEVAGLICAVGAQQADFEAYVEFLDRRLDSSKDFILLDFSEHQPDMISGADPSPWSGVPANDLAYRFKANSVPVLLADDCAPEVLHERARAMLHAGVPVVGIDTQNAVEVPKVQQRYRLLSGSGDPVQGLIRKSPELLCHWHRVVERFSDDMDEAFARRVMNQ
jgi:phosphoserine phosphatase